jgi:hypothetical protein
MIAWLRVQPPADAEETTPIVSKENVENLSPAVMFVKVVGGATKGSRGSAA